MVERHDHKLEELIIDVLGTDIRRLPMFLLTKYITHAHKDMKEHMSTDRQMHTHTHTRT